MVAPGAGRLLARELAPVAQAQFLSVATSRLVPIALPLVAGDLAAGHFGAAFRVYDVVWVAVISPRRPFRLARTLPGSAKMRALTRQAFEARCSSRCRSPGLGVGASC